MKTDMILKAINSFIQTQDNNFITTYNKALNLSSGDLKEGVKYNLPEYILADLVKELKLDIIASYNDGKSNKIKAALRILKSSEKNKRLLYQKANMKEYNGKLYQVICDGYRVVRMADALENIPINSDDYSKMTMDFESMFRDARLYTNELTIPSLAELKAELKIDKATKNFYEHNGYKKIFVYDFNNYNEKESPICDIEFLIDVIEMIPDGKIYYKDSLLPIYITNGKDDALVLPLRKYSTDDGEIKKILANKRDYIIIDNTDEV